MMQQIFNVDDDSIGRGGIGVATNGPSETFFDSLSVKHYNPS